MSKGIYLAALLAMNPMLTLAAQKTVTLSVPGMSCGACPITVKKALTRVEGVSRADVDFDKRQATVTFDDAKADVATLTRATEDAGYPASVKGGAQ
jgi:mercuric ion binding protein